MPGSADPYFCDFLTSTFRGGSSAPAFLDASMNTEDPIFERDGTRPAMTLEEVAAKLGISKERVRQIEQNALYKLKRAMHRNGYRREDFFNNESS